MYKKHIYKYKDQEGNTVISPCKPDCECELMYRLISHSEDYLVTNYTTFTQCIDIPVSDVESWFEVHKDDLENPTISMKEELEQQASLNDEQDALIIELATQLAILNLTL